MFGLKQPLLCADFTTFNSPQPVTRAQRRWYISPKKVKHLSGECMKNPALFTSTPYNEYSSYLAPDRPHLLLDPDAASNLANLPSALTNLKESSSSIFTNHKHNVDGNTRVDGHTHTHLS